MARDPLIGQSVGSVRLLARLGAGAMGVVYKGFHNGFAREVAVKFLTATGATSRERFVREGRAAAKVDHPHVVKILDAGEHQGRAYLVLEFIDGRSLGDLLDAQETQDRSLPPEGRPVGSLPNFAAIFTLGEQICRGLAAIHAAGIVHRDIKPDNVLVTQDGRAKVADLGLAKVVEEPDALRLTGSGMVVGTPLYVSPEGVRDPQTIGPASDLYCLGGTLYHLVAGKPPFVCATAYDVLRAHLEEKPVPLAQVRPDVPAELARLIERCLDKRPERRPTAEALAQALAAAGEGRHQGWGAVAAFTVLIGGCAAVTLTSLWFALRPTTPAVTIVPPVPIRLLVNHPLAEVRIDDGTWTPLQDGTVAVPVGPRVLTVRVAGAGPLLAWTAPVEATPGTTPTLAVTLAPVPVPHLRHRLPGTGMAWCNGVAVGLDSQIPLTMAGTYHLGRWDGAVWRKQTVSIDARGQADASPVTTSDRPDGPAWWRASDDQQLPLPPHHVASWWEVDNARQRRRLPLPPGWQLVSPAPHEPAGLVPQLLVSPLLEDVVRIGGRLPDEATATVLAAAYRTGVWAAGSPPVVVGAPLRTAGRLIVVP